MKYVKITWTDTVWLLLEFENLKFFIYVLNNSFNIPSKFLKFQICIDEGYLEGSVSQSFHIGPRFCFM